MNRVTFVSMSGLRVGHEKLLEAGMQLPGLSKRASALAQLPPLGLLTIAGTLDSQANLRDWNRDLVCDVGSEPVEQIVEQIIATDPDLVAFSSLTPAVDRAIEISHRLRELKICTVLGGLHATAAPETCSLHFDAVACGDGERLFPRIVSDYISGHLKPLYRDDGTFPIDQSPLPQWNLMSHSSLPRFTLQTLRGCPWSCSFCAASRLLGPARTKSNRRVQAELELIKSHRDRPWIELADDNTFAANRDYEEFLDILQQSGARWFTESDWRLANSDSVLKRLARSGCQQILVGMESSVFRYPGMGGKTASIERMLEACVKIQEHGIVVNACFIVGADGETRESIERLAVFLEDAPFGEIQLTLQTPFPGTSLYQSLAKQDRLLDSDFRRYTLFDVVFRPDCMSASELETCFHKLIVDVFSVPNERRRSEIRKRIKRVAFGVC